jgi:hypothetical protein
MSKLTASVSYREHTDAANHQRGAEKVDATDWLTQDQHCEK